MINSATKQSRLFPQKDFGLLRFARNDDNDKEPQMSVRIVDVCEVTKPISSPIRNAYIDFTKMTTEPRRRRHRCQTRRQTRGRLRLQFQRPLRAGRPDPRALRAAPDGGRTEIAAERGRRQSRSRQGLGHHDVEREAGRPRRALGRGRHHRHGGVGRGGEDRGQAAVSFARRASQAQRPIPKSSSMPPAAIIIPARTSRCCAAKCAAISTADTTW